MVLDLYNSGLYLLQIYKFLGTISLGTLRRWVKSFNDYGTEGLLPQRKTNRLIPKIVYQDNGKAFKAKYFQHIDCLVGGDKRTRSEADFSPLPSIRFDECGFNGVYASLLAYLLHFF